MTENYGEHRERERQSKNPRFYTRHNAQATQNAALAVYGPCKATDIFIHNSILWLCVCVCVCLCEWVDSYMLVSSFLFFFHSMFILRARRSAVKSVIFHHILTFNTHNATQSKRACPAFACCLIRIPFGRFLSSFFFKVEKPHFFLSLSLVSM